MKILHGSDFHIGLTRHSSPGTSSRLDDFATTLKRFAHTAVEQKADVAILAGDTFHTRRPTPRDLLALMTALNVLRDGDVTTLIASGNHDGPDAVGDSRTSALSWMSELGIPGVHAITEPFSGLLQTKSLESFGVVAIPYPHRRSFDALMPDATPEERVEEISRRLESAIETLYDKVVSTGSGTEPIIFVGHLSTIGAQLGTEVTMRFGWDVAVRSGLLDRFDYAALGHIHRQQQVGERGFYPGSPEFMDFGEEGQQKGFLLAEVERGKTPVVTVIDSKPRPMMTLEPHRVGDEWKDTGFERVKGAIVRLRIYPEGDESLSAMEAVKLVKEYRLHGATHVQSEVVLPEKERAVRVAVDPNMEATEALRRWLAANGYPEEPYLSAGIELLNTVGAGHE